MQLVRHNTHICVHRQCLLLVLFCVSILNVTAQDIRDVNHHHTQRILDFVNKHNFTIKLIEKARIKEVSRVGSRYRLHIQAYSRDGLYQAAEKYERGKPKTIEIIDIETDAVFYQIPTNRNAITSMQFSTDGKSLGVTTADGFKEIKIFDVRGGTLRRVIEWMPGTQNPNYVCVSYCPVHLTNISYSPNGKQIAMGNGSGEIKIWDVYGNEWHTFAHKDERSLEESRYIFEVRYNYNGTYLISKKMFSIDIFYITSLKKVFELNRNSELVNHVIIDYYGKTKKLILGNIEANVIEVWDIYTHSMYDSVPFNFNMPYRASAKDVIVQDIRIGTPRNKDMMQNIVFLGSRGEVIPYKNFEEKIMDTKYAKLWQEWKKNFFVMR